MKKLFATISIILFFSTTFSQENYVSVHVEHKLVLQPKQITFDLSVGESSKIFGISFPNAKMKEESGDIEVLKKQITEQLLNFLNEKKMSFNVVNVEDVQIFSNGGSTTKYRLIFKDKHEFINFKNDLKNNVTGISGEVSDVQYSEPGSDLNAFYNKLVQKANTESEILAQAINKKLVKLSLVREIQYTQDYMSLMANFQSQSKNFFDPSIPLEKETTRTFEFKYLIE